MLSLAGVYPDEIGNTILLTRLERGSTPITVRIPTANREVQRDCVLMFLVLLYIYVLPNAVQLRVLKR